MTRKDYIIIANVMIAQIELGYVRKADILGFIQEMADALEDENPKFDSEKFEDYIRGLI